MSLDAELKELEDLQAAADAYRQRREAAGIREVPETPRHISSAIGLRRLPPPSPEEVAAREAAEQERERRAAEWEAKAEERARASREARAESMLPGSFRWARLDAPELRQRIANPLAISLAARLTLSDRAVFLGPSGSGKTSLAAAAARNVALSGKVDVRFESALSLAVARSRHPLGEGEPEAIMRSMRADLLVLDELGSDELVHGSAIKELVFERHWQARATWVTTWMTPEQVSAKYGDGWARRIFDGAAILDCGMPAGGGGT